MTKREKRHLAMFKAWKQVEQEREDEAKKAEKEAMNETVLVTIRKGQSNGKQTY